MGNHTKYDFPSSFIEGPLRRKSKVQKVRWLYWVVIVMGILIVIGSLYRVHTPVIHTAHAQVPTVKYHGKILALGTFCAQAVLDHDTYGRDLSADLRDYCGL